MKTSSQRLILILIASALWLIGGTSCRNTVHGVGRDVERAGHNIHRAAH